MKPQIDTDKHRLISKMQTKIQTLPSVLIPIAAFISAIPGITLWMIYFFTPYFVPDVGTPGRYALGMLLGLYMGLIAIAGCIMSLVILLSRMPFKYKLVTTAINFSFILYVLILILIERVL